LANSQISKSAEEFEEWANAQITKLANQPLVKVDPEYYRPTEVDLLIGDPTKSKTQLGWEPKYDLAGLVKEMVVSDLKLY
jgi:GDPmannose 4,6-dehydratase